MADADRGSYTNYWHGDLPDREAGHDPDFSHPHLDPGDTDQHGQVNGDFQHFQEQQQKLTFYNSAEYRQAEQARVSLVLGKEHEVRSPGRVWCPDVGQVRPEWLCDKEHGDYDPRLDEDPESND
jgi:hypothetical protein